MSDLREQISGLSTEQKAELLDALWESIEEDAATLTPAQIAELDRRVALYKEDPSRAIPWEKVRADLFKKS